VPVVSEIRAAPKPQQVISKPQRQRSFSDLVRDNQAATSALAASDVYGQASAQPMENAALDIHAIEPRPDPSGSLDRYISVRRSIGPDESQRAECDVIFQGFRRLG